MRVLVLPSDPVGGCSFYRMTEPARVLTKQGYPVRTEYGKTFMAWWQGSPFGDRLTGLKKSVKADVVVLQRPLLRVQYEMIGALQADGVTVVVEVDDDFHAIHPKNLAHNKTNPLLDRDVNRDWLMKSCKRADLVTVATPALARRYGEHGRVVVLPNFVPKSYLSLMKRRKRIAESMLGWAGSVSTHPTDLEVTEGAMPVVLEKTGAHFHVVGDGHDVGRQLRLPTEPTNTGLLPFRTYHEAVAQLDVGIVPLARLEFNEAKSWLKGLEYAAVGVPFVATPTEQYRMLADEGLGWLAETREEWLEKTTELLSDIALQEILAMEWRQRVADEFTIEGNAHLWWEAWERARATSS